MSLSTALPQLLSNLWWPARRTGTPRALAGARPLTTLRRGWTLTRSLGFLRKVLSSRIRARVITGNCLFLALAAATSTPDKPRSHRQVRQFTVAKMRDRGAELQTVWQETGAFGPDGRPSAWSWTQYLEKEATNGEWAGALELGVFAVEHGGLSPEARPLSVRSTLLWRALKSLPAALPALSLLPVLRANTRLRLPGVRL